MKLKIISYNILADYLGKPDYMLVNKKYLNIDFRLKLLFKKIDNILDDNTIFCLQEVGLKQLSELQLYFFKHNFHVIYAREIAIIFSISKFKILSLNIGNIKDLKYLIDKKHHELLESKNKFYIILSLQDKLKKRKFTISNTHLISPPELNNLKFLQCYVILKKLEEYFNIIFCGDLNSLPNSDVIGLLSNSNINTKLGIFNLNNKYKSSINHNLITHHTKNVRHGIFTAMLDYIFVQDNIKVKSCSKLNVKSKFNENNLLPNKSEPSDHVMICNEISI